MILSENFAAHIKSEQQRLWNLLAANIPDIDIISHAVRSAEKQDKKANLASYAVTPPNDRAP